MKLVWNAVQQAAVDLCTENNHDFYRFMLLLEESFSSQSLLSSDVPLYEPSRNAKRSRH
jgi:hypothetical protein